jgi:hypothetical protein
VDQAGAGAKPGQARAGLPQRLGIGVQAQEPYAAAARFQQRLRVSAHPHRPVDHPTLASRPQKKRDLVDEDRNVNR